MDRRLLDRALPLTDAIGRPSLLAEAAWSAGGYSCTLRRPIADDDRVGWHQVREVRAAVPRLLTAFGLPSTGALFLDVEATGLGGTGSVPCVIGCLEVADDGLVAHQFVLLDYPGEAELLAAFTRLITGCLTLVTFNGRTYDWPLLEGRFPLYRLKRPPLPPHLDLLPTARRVWKQRLGSCTLANLERHIGRSDRDDDIPGGFVCVP